MSTTARRGTPEQLRAITAAGVDLCVVAGAGTGKTFVLTERVVERVVRGGVDLRQVLAITFTEKAAAEMKERLASALEAAGRGTARQEVEAAAISTVHAFCARMLRENAVAAGVDPAFRVLDEVEADRTLRAALDALVDAWREDAPADFETLALLGGDDPAETLLDVYREAQSSGRPVGEFVRQVDGLPDLAPLVRRVRDVVTELAPLADSGTDAARRNVAAALAAAAGFPDDASPADDILAVLDRLNDAVKLNCGKPAKDVLAALREACGEALAVAAEHAIAPLREVAARAVELLDALYHDAKGRGESLDFADLERSAVALLDARPDVRSTVAARWPEVLVDEFQDTNPVQARLVELLRTPARLFVVGDPKQSIYGFRGADVSVFEDHLAAVAAQGRDGVVALRHSFRTRPEVLGAVNRLFEGGVGGGAGAASQVDLVAGRAWPPAAGPAVEVAVFAEESMPEARAREATWIAERIAALCDGSFFVGAPTAGDPCGVRPAGFGDVAVLLRATTHVKVLEQALVAHDVPYLVVKGRGFFHAREVVDAAHVLACVDDPRDDLALATVLRSPACGLSDDGLFALTAARGKGGVLIDVLTAWAARETAVEGLTSGDTDTLRRFAATLAELRARRGADGVAALVERMFDRTRLDVIALGRPNGRQRAANLRKVRSLARTADAAGLSLAAFVEELRTLRAREVREAEAAVAGGASGAVSLMTVHAAKGLEFPVVFVPDAGRAEQSRAGRIVSHVRGGVGLRMRSDGATDVKPWAFVRLAERKAAAETAESERLLYVAVTRAADHLVVSASMSPRGDDGRRVWWNRVAGAFDIDGAPEETRDVDVGPAAADVAAAPVGASSSAAARSVVRVHAVGKPAADGPPPVSRTLLGRVAREVAAGTVPPLRLRPEARAEASALLTEAERVAPSADGTPYATNVSALTTFERCPQEYRLRHVVGVPEGDDGRLFAARTAFDPDAAPAAPEPRPGDEDEPDVEPSSRALGRAAHAALERLVPAFTGDIAREVELALRAEAGGAAPDPAQAAELVRWIELFRASALGAEVAGARRADVRREQAFLLQAGRTVVRGQIDLLWRANDGWVVVDWKTGSFRTAHGAHALQMRLYALGVRAVTGVLPSRLLLWSLPLGRAVDVALGAGDVAQTEALLRDFAARAAVRGWAPRKRPPCGDCRVRAACQFALDPSM